MVRAVVALSTCLFWLASAAQASNPLSGEWKIALAGDDVSVSLDLMIDDDGAGDGQWHTAPAIGLAMTSGVTRARVEILDNDAFEITCRIADDIAVFRGDLANGHLQSGRVRMGGRDMPFRMYRLAGQPADYESQFVGAYRFPTGQTFVVTWNEHGHMRLVEIGESARTMAGLFPMSRNAFAPGPELVRDGGPEQWFVFTRDRNRVVNGLVHRDPNGATRRAERVDLFHQERVVVRNGDVTLAGTLLTPLTSGPHPGVVLVHGEEITHRSELLPEAADLVEKGLAVLIYDLRGHAGSGGQPPSSPVDMAGDAFAALTFMQSLDGVSTTEGGLLLAQKHFE